MERIAPRYERALRNAVLARRIADEVWLYDNSRKGLRPRRVARDVAGVGAVAGSGLATPGIRARDRRVAVQVSTLGNEGGVHATPPDDRLHATRRDLPPQGFDVNDLRGGEGQRELRVLPRRNAESLGNGLQGGTFAGGF